MIHDSIISQCPNEHRFLKFFARIKQIKVWPILFVASKRLGAKDGQHVSIQMNEHSLSDTIQEFEVRCPNRLRFQYSSVEQLSSGQSVDDGHNQLGVFDEAMLAPLLEQSLMIEHGT